MGRLAVLVAITLASAFSMGGCAQDAPPSSDELLKGLSALILAPEASCEELRARFGLEKVLPLAETPLDAGMLYEEHYIVSSSGAILRVWHMPTRLNRGLVVLSSGSNGSMACYLYTSKLLVQNGWSVVMYDYEGFGRSSGVPSLESLVPTARVVLDWALEHTGRTQATLMGVSLGSIPSIALGVERPENVNAVVLDSPVSLSMELERFSFLLGRNTPKLVASLSTDLLTEQLITELHKPLLVFLHEYDLVTPPASIELLYSRAPGPKQLVRFPELPHAYGVYYRTDTYTANLEAFLSSAWSSAR